MSRSGSPVVESIAAESDALLDIAESEALDIEAAESEVGHGEAAAEVLINEALPAAAEKRPSGSLPGGSEDVAAAAGSQRIQD